MDDKELTQPAAAEGPKGFAWEVYSWLQEIVACIAVITIVFVFLIRLVSVSGDSMYPTLHNADKVALLSNFISTDYDQGDIVVLLQDTYNENEPLIKRVIATAGQTVDIDYDQGVVYVDGEALDESYTAEPTNRQGTIALPATVPEGCVFVLGDNRNHSSDSRYAEIGMIDTRQIMGRVLWIALPFKNMGKPNMGQWAAS